MTRPFDPSQLSFRYDSHSHMVTYRGQDIGGSAAAFNAVHRNGAMKAADLKLFREAGERDVRELAAGRGTQYMRKCINRIDSEVTA